jgi:hypothetical protein
MSPEQETVMARDPEMTLDSFLQHLANQEHLDIRFGRGAKDSLARGGIPTGYALHRIEPLFRGGTNNLSNLLLVKEVFRRNYNKPLCWYENGENPFQVGKAGGGGFGKLFGRGKTNPTSTKGVVCEYCKQQLDEGAEDAARIDAAGKKRTPIAIECSACRQVYLWQPAGCNAEDIHSDIAPRCPAAGCDGWVVFVQETADSSFLGCGECGNVWRSRAALNAAIEKVCGKYSYRAACYFQSEQGYIGVPLEDEVEGYREMVLEEEY